MKKWETYARKYQLPLLKLYNYIHTLYEMNNKKNNNSNNNHHGNDTITHVYNLN